MVNDYLTNLRNSLPECASKHLEEADRILILRCKPEPMFPVRYSSTLAYNFAMELTRADGDITKIA